MYLLMWMNSIRRGNAPLLAILPPEPPTGAAGANATSSSSHRFAILSFSDFAPARSAASALFPISRRDFMAASRTAGSSLPSCSTSFAGSVVEFFGPYCSFRYFAP